MSDRPQRLLTFIEQATGKASYRGPVQEKGPKAKMTRTMLKPSVLLLLKFDLTDSFVVITEGDLA